MEVEDDYISKSDFLQFCEAVVDIKKYSITGQGVKWDYNSVFYIIIVDVVNIINITKFKIKDWC